MKNLEIERKFLVDREKWENLAKPEGMHYRQGYLAADENKTVRVRVAGDQGTITIKGKTEGISRTEFEYRIPGGEALELIEVFAKEEVQKVRYRIPVDKWIWEVDVFGGKNKGLILAEIELKSEDESVTIPPWISAEVTDDVRYYNLYLSVHPFSEW
jgi:CYTH domain-containing protein